jgi:hypothetical protein
LVFHVVVQYKNKKTKVQFDTAKTDGSNFQALNKVANQATGQQKRAKTQRVKNWVGVYNGPRGDTVVTDEDEFIKFLQWGIDQEDPRLVVMPDAEWFKEPEE